MNNFINVTKILKIMKDSKGRLNSLEDFLKEFESPSSIEKSTKEFNATEKFSFGHVKDHEVRKFIMNLDGSKVNPAEDVKTSN